MKQNRRLEELDALRGIAAISVVLFHYTSFYARYAGPDYKLFLNFKYGGFGVELFFIISGFVIYMTVIKCTDTKEFLIKRIIRLYPAYIVSVLTTFLITSSYHHEALKVSPKEFFINLTMLQNIVPGYYVKNVDGSYWSLAVEISFYLVCSILLSLGFIRKPFLICITWLGFLFFIKLLYKMKMFYPIVMIIGEMNLIQYSHLFVAGIAFYQLKNQGFIGKSPFCYHLIIFIAFLYNYKILGFPSSSFVAVFFVTFYLLLLNKLNFLNVKFLTYLGSISYSLYLIHQNIGYIIIKFLEETGFNHQIFIIVPLIFSLVLATFITFYFEKPIQNWSLSKLKNNVKNTSSSNVTSM